MLKYDKPFTPPVQLKIAGGLLLLEFLLAVVLTLTADRTGLSPLTIQVIIVFINSVACIFLGIAANKLGKSWLLYALLPALGMLMLLALYSLYKLWSDAWFSWADHHATYSSEHSA